jgi:hypothetical protein
MIHLCRRLVIPRIEVHRVPRGPAGTLATARMIRCMILRGAKDFFVRQKAIQIFCAYQVRAKDRLGEVCALFDWVRRNIRYTRDIFRVELLHAARRMLELRAGDCDDMTILLGAMLVSTGHPVRLVLVGFQRQKPNVYTHIYPEVRVGGHWVAIDATSRHPIGWSPPALWKRVCELGKDELRCSPKT